MAGTLTTREPRVLRARLRRGPFAVLREEMHDLVSQVFGEEGSGSSLDRITPPIDLSETEQAVEARMNAPGIKPEDIDVQVNGNLLTISGHRREEKEEKGRTFHRIERSCGCFSRAMTLPCDVNESKVEAKYRDGVLTVTLPKSEEAKAHKIKVNA